jgi:hypothetical protein
MYQELTPMNVFVKLSEVALPDNTYYTIVGSAEGRMFEKLTAGKYEVD